MFSQAEVVTQLKLQKLKEVRKGEHDYLGEDIFQRLDLKEQGYPRTLGNRMGLKELARLQKISGEPEVFGDRKNRSKPWIFRK